MTPRPLPDLPGRLAEPLHLLEPTWSLWPWLLTLLLASAAFAYFRHRFRQYLARRRQPRDVEPEAGAAALPAAPALSEIEQRIRELRLAHRSPESIRRGCHLLSELMRGHLADSLAARLVPFDPTCLTGREMGWLFGGPVRRFFFQLTALQFGRPEPHRNELDQACDEAVALARSEPLPKRRWARRGAGADGDEEGAA